MIALLQHEWRQARGDTGGLATSLLFLFATVAVAAFAIGADLPRLAATGPAILWIAVLLSALLGNERLFAPDAADGTLHVVLSEGVTQEAYVAVKLLVKWVTVLPLVASALPAGALLAMPGGAIWGASLTLLIGSPALTALSAFGAALSFNGRGVLGPIVAMPLLVPVVIFGASAASAWGTEGFATPFLLLAACSLVAAAIAPFAIAGLLRARR